LAEELIAGRYTIQEELGRGASATVFRAHDTLLERPVALKVIASSLASDPEFTWRFEQEARLAARLDHPNIVTVYDVGMQPDGRAFIAMRLLQGKPLDKLIADRRELPQEEVVDIVGQLAAALDYTHAAGLVHRDVKPSNVTVDEQGRVTLTDFGIARALDSARVTLPGLTIGTPRYMSPEQVRGEDTTPGTDEYSLAVMAYEMLAGRPPFQGDGTTLMYKIVHEQPPAPNEFNPRLSTAVADVFRKALAKAPGERWASAGEFAREMRSALTATVAQPDVDEAALAETTVMATPPTVVHRTVVAESPPEPTVVEQARPITIIPPANPPSAPETAPTPQPVTMQATNVGATSATEAAPAPAPAARREASQIARERSAPEVLGKGAALVWAGGAALVVGGAALAAFLALGGGDGEGRFEGDTEQPGAHQQIIDEIR
jgi:eukaryotic-like serine/threonine-protein kinase